MLKKIECMKRHYVSETENVGQNIPTYYFVQIHQVGTNQHTLLGYVFPETESTSQNSQINYYNVIRKIRSAIASMHTCMFAHLPIVLNCHDIIIFLGRKVAHIENNGLLFFSYSSDNRFFLNFSMNRENLKLLQNF